MIFMIIKKKRKLEEDKKRKERCKNKNWELPLKSCHLEICSNFWS